MAHCRIPLYTLLHVEHVEVALFVVVVAVVVVAGCRGKYYFDCVGWCGMSVVDCLVVLTHIQTLPLPLLLLLHPLVDDEEDEIVVVVYPLPQTHPHPHHHQERDGGVY